MRSASTNRAPAPSAGSRSVEAAAHALGQLAADREAEPEAARPGLRAAAVEALEDQLAVVLVDPGPAVGDLDRRVHAVVRGHDADGLALGRVAQRVVDEDAHDARDGARVPGRPARAGRGLDAELDAAVARLQLELGDDRAAQLAELDRLGAHRDGGVEAAEVEELGREAPEAPQLALGAGDLLLGVAGVEAAVAQVLPEQLERPLQRRQRRPQLVRRGGDERAARRLLASERLLHGRERAGEVADLVAAAVARRGRVGALGRDADGDGPQPGEAPRQRRRERDAEHDRDDQPDAGRGDERGADLVDGGVDVGERPLRDEQEVLVLGVALGQAAGRGDGEELRDDRDRVVTDRAHVVAVDDRAVEQVRRQRAGRVRVVDALGNRVGDDDARARALAQQGRPALRVEEELGAADALGLLGRVAQRLAEHLLELRDVGLRRGLEVVDALGAQPVLERRQQRGRRDRERQRARRHEGDEQPAAQAGAPEDLPHCSRKRYPAPRTVRIRLGSSGFSSSFSRRWRMWTSIARGSR